MRSLSIIVISLTLSACAGLSNRAPNSLNLSGTWVLNPALSDIPAPPVKGSTTNRSQYPGQRKGGMRGGASGGRGKGGNRGTSGRSGRGKPPRSSTPQNQGGQGGALSISMREKMMSLKANKLKIEQNSDSTGIQFSSRQDQGYRDLSWGKKKKANLKIESGWDENMFVVKMNNGRMKLIESYIISDDAQQLTVFIELSGGRQGAHKLRKVFERER